MYKRVLEKENKSNNRREDSRNGASENERGVPGEAGLRAKDCEAYPQEEGEFLGNIMREGFRH